MKPIFKELIFRSLYVFILALIYSIYIYLSYAVQLEYFSSVFAYVYQSPDFDYARVHFEHTGLHAMIHKWAFLPHGSLSWNQLSFANVLYFYNLELNIKDYHGFVVFYVFLTLFSFLTFQSCAFASSGMFAAGRKGFIFLLVFSLILPLCGLQWAFDLAALNAELRFETYDSELFCTPMASSHY